MKRLFCLLLAICMTVTLSGCRLFSSAQFLYLVATGDDRAEKEDIFTFVTENESALLSAISDGDFSAYENKGFIRSVNAGEKCVDFSCGGIGVGSGTAYVGFYYTVQHDMTAMWCVPDTAELQSSGNGFSWQEANGDDCYYTEHICGGFYYYEASF